MEVKLNSPSILTKMEFNRVESCLNIIFLLQFKDMDCWSWHCYIFSTIAKCHWTTSGCLFVSKTHFWQFIFIYLLFILHLQLLFPAESCSSGLTDRGKGQRLIMLPRNRFDSRVTDLALSLSWRVCNSHLCKSRTRPGVFSSPWQVSGNITSSASCLSWSIRLLEGGRQDTVMELMPWHQTDHGRLWNQWTAGELHAEIHLENKGEKA